MNAEEIWVKIPDVVDGYEASTHGRIRSIDRIIITSVGKRKTCWGRILKPKRMKNGYECVWLFSEHHAGRQRCVLVHRLIASAFIPNPLNRKMVNHKDGVRHNNAPFNLEWMNCSENHLHAYSKLGREGMKGVIHPLHKLTESQVIEIRKMTGSASHAAIGRMYGVTDGCIRAIVNRRNWRHI